MDKQALLRALQVELQRHDLGIFVDELRGGRGVVMPGCSMCRKRLNTSSQLVALPPLMRGPGSPKVSR
jgi:hypothetical protein